VKKGQVLFRLRDDEQRARLQEAETALRLAEANHRRTQDLSRDGIVAPSLNPQNRRILVKARVPNPDLTLRPGLFATVEARLGERENVLAVPDSAVVYGTDGTFVWRIGADQKAATATVELGMRHDGQVEVRSGLQAGDVVVVAGTNKLAPGIGVEAVPADAKPVASRTGADGVAPAGEAGS
jgi:membrane fusion protein (multidrug efflux system)